jgi:GAF domain-containing protein
VINDAPSLTATAGKAEIYREVAQSLAALLGDERDVIANAANTAALLFMTLPEVNWAGFYFLRGGALVLGPFQGKPACVRIAVGQGVCGTAAKMQRSVLVPDVHDFPGHIACDVASASELVVPLIAQGRLRGVLDLDSPVKSRFDHEDQTCIEKIAAYFVMASDWEQAEPAP